MDPVVPLPTKFVTLYAVVKVPPERVETPATVPFVSVRVWLVRVREPVVRMPVLIELIAPVKAEAVMLDVSWLELMNPEVPRPWTVLAILAGSSGTAPLILEIVAFEADKNRVMVDPIVMVGGRDVAWMYQRFVDPAWRVIKS